MCVLRFAYLCATVQTHENMRFSASQKQQNKRKVVLIVPLLMKRLPNGNSKRICAEVIL